MWIGISLVSGDRSKQVVAIQELCDIELLRRLEGEKGLFVSVAAKNRAILAGLWPCFPRQQPLLISFT